MGEDLLSRAGGWVLLGVRGWAASVCHCQAVTSVCVACTAVVLVRGYSYGSYESYRAV
eukprot:COSAG01_NODE_24671_length_771_cov_0.784226_1_plen_58_part_00